MTKPPTGQVTGLENIHPPKVTDEDRKRAMRTVTGNAHDADDARLLLQMLGLIEDPDAPCLDPDPSTYGKRRCRCDGCREAATAYRRAGREEGRFYKEPKEHGSFSTYTNYGCRCDPCRVANREHVRRYREKRLARQADARRAG